VKKSERAQLVQQRLAELYPDPPVPLNHSNPFTLLVAVLLSAQCTDERVNKVTPALFRRAKSAKAMTSKVPANFEDLEKLPGVGHKTASVVMAQAFGVPAFPVDTHIHRLAQRWGLTNGKNVKQTEADLKKLFSEDSWNDLHLQIIFYGREYCTARGCDGRTCDLCRSCYPNRRKPFVAKKP